MKKVLSLIVVLAMVAAFAVAMSADALDNLPSDVDKGIKIASTATAPVVDGMLDEGVYTQIFAFSGQDAWDAARGGGNEVEYNLLTIPKHGVDNWILGGNNPDVQVENLCSSKVAAYATWTAEKLYVCVVVDMGEMPYYFNPDAEWQGTNVQFAFTPKNGPLCEEGTNEGQIDHTIALVDAATAVAKTTVPGPFNVNLEDQEYAGMYDGASTAVYEWSYNLADFELEGKAGTEILFAMGFNFNTADDLSTSDWFGYQVGCGVYAIKERNGELQWANLTNSLYLVFSGEAAEVVEPEEPAEEPEAPVEEPEAPVEEPEAPVEEPETPVEEPETPVEEPEAPVEEPEAPVEEPEAPVEEPEAPVEEPEQVETPEVPETVDVSVIMYVLAALSTIGGAIVLKRR